MPAEEIRRCYLPQPPLSRARAESASDYDCASGASTNTLDAHGAGIRRRVQEGTARTTGEPPVIATERGVGYRLERRVP